jgi:hypothetical protein
MSPLNEFQKREVKQLMLVAREYLRSGEPTGFRDGVMSETKAAFMHGSLTVYLVAEGGSTSMIAAIYARKSTDQNLPNEEKSVTRQLERARAGTVVRTQKQEGWIRRQLEGLDGGRA